MPAPGLPALPILAASLPVPRRPAPIARCPATTARPRSPGRSWPAALLSAVLLSAVLLSAVLLSAVLLSAVLLSAVLLSAVPQPVGLPRPGGCSSRHGAGPRGGWRPPRCLTQPRSWWPVVSPHRVT